VTEHILLEPFLMYASLIRRLACNRATRVSAAKTACADRPDGHEYSACSLEDKSIRNAFGSELGRDAGDRMGAQAIDRRSTQQQLGNQTVGDTLLRPAPVYLVKRSSENNECGQPLRGSVARV